MATSAGVKTSVESIPQLVSHHGGSKLSLEPTTELTKSADEGLKWSSEDLFVADLIMRTVTVHHQYFTPVVKEERNVHSKTAELAVSGSNRSRSSTPTLSQPHNQLRSKDSSSSVSSSESTQRSSCDEVADPAGNVEDVDGHGSIKGVECSRRSPAASVCRGSLPPSPVPSQQSGSGVILREKRRKGNWSLDLLYTLNLRLSLIHI